MRYKTLLKLTLLAVPVFCIAAGTEVSAQDADKPLKVISKQQPDARGCRPGTSGRATVRVTFDKSGKVTEAEMISPSGCAPFDKSALLVARKIKFEPAKKKGTAVTTVRPVEFSYAIY